MITRFAHRAEEATARSLLLSVLCAVITLLIPVLFSLLRQYPYEICTRFYRYEITAESFTVDDGIVVFRNNDTVLAAPAEYFPDSDFANGDYYAIFDRLALLNNYYRDVLLPVLLLVSVMVMLTLFSLSGMLAGLMGLGRMMTHAMPYKKRIRIFAACAWLPALPSALFGFLLPVFHIFIYQLLLGFFVWRVQKVL